MTITNPVRRRRDFHRIAASLAVAGVPEGMALRQLIDERDHSPRDDPSRAWTDGDLADLASRVYATHRDRSRVAP